MKRDMMNQKIDLQEYLAAKRSCVICGQDGFSPWCTEGIFQVVQCNACGLVFVNPCLNDEGLELVYQGHHNNRVADSDECKKRDRMYLLDRDFLEETINNGAILDVGCGGGFFLEKFDQDKWDRIGLEIDPDTAPYAQRHFGINVEIGTSERIPFEDHRFNVVSFRGSFEHLVNPQVSMQEIERVTANGGYLYLCATPNVASFCARLYRNKWNQFDAKEHIFMYSAETLAKLVEPFGYKGVKSAYFYEETPYCNIEEDMVQVLKDYQSIQQGEFEKVATSPAFWGNMLNILFRKF